MYASVSEEQIYLVNTAFVSYSIVDFRGKFNHERNDKGILTMNTCNQGHKEVIYECDECPVCKAINEQLELLSQIESGLNNTLRAIKDSREES